MIRLGTRGSALALAQARWVAERLGDEAELVEITTAGDLARDIGDKSRWTGALERALLGGEIDVAVHSAKDVPIELAAGTAVVAVPEREDPRDVLVGAPSLDALPRRRARRDERAAPPRAGAGRAPRPRRGGDPRQRRHAAAQARGRGGRRARARRRGARAARRATTSRPRRSHVFMPAPGQGCLLLQAADGRDAARGRRRRCPRGAARRARAWRRRWAPPATRRWACSPRAGACGRGRGCPTARSGWPTRPRTPTALAGRMLAAGAADLLARAEAMAP